MNIFLNFKLIHSVRCNFSFSRLTILLVFFLSCMSTGALINSGPSLDITDSRVGIDFTVSEYADVAVEIVDVNQKMVRHLGAGMLGVNAPTPFTASSLTQHLEWDWKDDKGNVVGKSENYLVYVKGGLKPQFASIMAWNGQWLGTIKGMAVDSQGNLYVTMWSLPIIHRVEVHTIIFDRDGNYIKTFLPFPAGIDTSKMRGIKYIELEPGTPTPMLSTPYNHCPVPKLGVDIHKPLITKEGDFLFPNGNMHWVKEDAEINHEITYLSVIGNDGSIGEDYMEKKIAGPEPPYQGSSADRVFPRVFLGMSPDERYVYASGITASYSPPTIHTSGQWSSLKRVDHVVYRLDRNNNQAAEVFIGQKWTPGSGSNSLNNPLGIDVDANGDIIVCDFNNDRIVVYNSSGTFINSINIADPVQVAIHPASGKLYVYCAEILPDSINYYNALVKQRLVRLAGKNNAVKELEMVFDSVARFTKGVMTLDKNSNPPIIWLGGVDNVPRSSFESGPKSWENQVFKIEDRGSELKNLGNVIAAKNPDSRIGATHQFVDVDPENEEVWIDDKVFDGNTGQLKRTLIFSNEPSWQQTIGSAWEIKIESPTSVILRQAGYRGEKIGRFNRTDGKPVNFSGIGTHIITGAGLYPGESGDRQRGITLDKNGDIYVLHHGEDLSRWNSFLSVMAPDGTKKSDKLIHIESVVGGVAVDNSGDIYLGSHLKTYGKKTPSFFEDFFTKNNLPDAYTEYTKATGSMLKFSPSGGSILKDASSQDYHGRNSETFKASGVTWSDFSYTSQQGGYCKCESPRHGLDGHDRLFMPDPLRYSVVIKDKNGNNITRFGDYGNMDSRGPASAIPQPAIPFSYPLAVAVTNKAAYVNDYYNHRIVRVNLNYAESVFGTTLPVNLNKKNINLPALPILDFANPFNRHGKIRYFTPSSDKSTIIIYDISGRMVRSFGVPQTGRGAVFFKWDGRDEAGMEVPQGAYILKMQGAGNGRVLAVRKMILL
ncbi:MAG: FlgD immunoglobulin-like domain containing protein [bacterium]